MYYELNDDVYIVEGKAKSCIYDLGNSKLYSVNKALSSKLIQINEKAVLVEDNIDYDAGVILKKEVGSYVKKGDILCTIYGKKQESIDIDKIFKISKNKPKKKESLIIEII